jgi:hypothetical protein
MYPGQLIGNTDLKDKDFPLSIIIPLEIGQDRTVYIGTTKNTISVLRGQYLAFLGNVAHGGMTSVLRKGDPGNNWKCCVHIHLDSIHHDREQGKLSWFDMKECYCPIEHYKFLNREQLKLFLKDMKEREIPELEKQIQIKIQEEMNEKRNSKNKKRKI